jgi:hypothetical protein
LYVFCEGVREYEYFSFFDKLSEKIKLVVYPLDSEAEDNTPTGLYNIACSCLKPSSENPNPLYELSDDVDEVWIIFDKDTDKLSSREPQIISVKENCEKENSQLAREVWKVAESNPCFEVWLYYHFEVEKPNFEGIEISVCWKSFVNTISKSGFDPRKHPQWIRKAIDNSSLNYSEANERPEIASTQVFRLGESIYSLVKRRLSKT